MRMQAGFCTLYSFYAYPDRVRLRVSQVLVTPPHQRCGVGRALLQAAYEAAHARNAVDVTVRPARAAHAADIRRLPLLSMLLHVSLLCALHRYGTSKWLIRRDCCPTSICISKKQQKLIRLPGGQPLP